MNIVDGRTYFEAQVVEGLEEIAASELRRYLSSSPESQGTIRSIDRGRIKFSVTKIPGWFLALKTSAVIYIVAPFDIPRPKALLGDENFRYLLNLIQGAFELVPHAEYATFFVSAAGRDTTTLQRLRKAIEDETNLPEGTEQGDLLIRLRKEGTASNAWEVLVRLTPRPLSTRSWRVCDFEGALNATVAHAMALISRPDRADVVLNLGCGSGSLLIERLAAGPAAMVIGFDNDSGVLTCCETNLVEAQQNARIQLVVGNGRSLPHPARSIDAVLADLPFGHHIGSHEENLDLYPGLFSEVARILKTGGRFILVSHEVRLVESVISNSNAWSTREIIQINLRGLHPRIYVLDRK